MRPTRLLPVLFRVTLASATVTPVVSAADTVVGAVCVTSPRVVWMLNAPVLSRLPNAMGALPLICMAPPEVSVLCAPMFKADDVACDVLPDTVSCVAADRLDVCVIATPSAPALTPRPVPLKLTLLPLELMLAPFK